MNFMKPGQTRRLFYALLRPRGFSTKVPWTFPPTPVQPRVPAAASPVVQPGWYAPALFSVWTATALGVLALTLPPDDFYPTRIDPTLVLHPVTGSGPATHGAYEVVEEEKEKVPPVLEEGAKGMAIVGESSAEEKVDVAPAEVISTVIPVQTTSAIPVLPVLVEVETSTASTTTQPLPEETGSTAAVVVKPLVDPESGLILARYVLVGGGTASFSAMKAIYERDPKADVWIVTEEEHAPYMRPPLSKELWFGNETEMQSLTFKDWAGQSRSLHYDEPTGFQIIEASAPENLPLDQQLPKLLVGQAVTKLDVDAQVLELANGRRIKFGKLLLATGARPKVLPQVAQLPEPLRSTFSSFRTIKDFQSLQQAVASGHQHIVVVGGSFLGSELACALAHYGKPLHSRVTQIFPEEGNMGHVLPHYLMKWTTDRVRKEGVEVKPKVTIASVQPAPEGVSGVTLNLSDGSSLHADHVVMAVGAEPNVQLAQEAGLELDEKRGGILTNAELEARSNVFVAGDAGSFHDIALGRRRVEHHDHAILSGRVAGGNMTGLHKPFRHQSMFWSDLGPEIGYEAVGLLDGQLETVGVWAKASGLDTPQQAALSQQPSSAETPVEAKESNKEANMDEEYGKGVVFYVRQGKIVGVLLWNIFHRTPIARRIINEGRGVEDIASLAALFKLHEE